MLKYILLILSIAFFTNFTQAQADQTVSSDSTAISSDTTSVDGQGEVKKKREGSMSKFLKERDEKALSYVPSMTRSEAESMIKSLRLDSSSVKGLDVSQLSERYKTIVDFEKEFGHVIRYSQAYGADEETMQKLALLQKDLRATKALVKNNLETKRESEMREMCKELENLKSSDIYNEETNEFVNTGLIDRIKASIFDSPMQRNISTASIGHTYPGVSEYGINSFLSAIGYRLNINEKYNLSIVRLSNGEVKAILLLCQSSKQTRYTSVVAVY